jgi:hypothetical protein
MTMIFFATCLVIGTASSFVPASQRTKFSSVRLASSSDARTATTTTTKDELLAQIVAAPTGGPTPVKQTQEILRLCRALEKQCPTSDENVLPSLAGAWELLWTAQDPQSPETNRFLASWINPLENQSYSNNPVARSNPVLPVTVQDQLEKLGWLDSKASLLRSTQAVDIKSGQIQNVVVLNLAGRRSSLTVSIDFTPDQQDPRRVNVKFQNCRVSIPGLSDWNIPLGWIGPTGWLRTVYIDQDTRIMRGHKGSVFVLSRPAAQRARS